MSLPLAKDDEKGIILRQAQDDRHGAMVSLSNHDGQLGAFSIESKGIFKFMPTGTLP